MSDAPVRYRSDLVDSDRWRRLRFRPGDIVISTPPKCGTTWMQMICALLVLQTVELPAPLSALSPWLDLRLRPFDAVAAELSAQRHRRFIKTHTPLDGIPNRPDVTYTVLGRDPRDAAVSMYFHRANIGNREVRHHREASGPGSSESSLRDFLLDWIHEPRSASLENLAHHMTVAWHRRHRPNVVVMHYQELASNLAGAMKRIAGRLDIAVPAHRWPALVSAATFTQMRARARELAPAHVLYDSNRFFRSGSSGQWRGVLTGADLRRYERRVAALMPADLAAWLHR
jgi:hypothetical protein